MRFLCFSFWLAVSAAQSSAQAELLTADDPPIYLSCSLPDGEPTSRGHLLHHPRHAQVIERRCKELGIPVTAVYAGDQNRPAKAEGAVAFLLRHVGLPVAGGN
jgi:hypothetical protein